MEKAFANHEENKGAMLDEPTGVREARTFDPKFMRRTRLKVRCPT